MLVSHPPLLFSLWISSVDIIKTVLQWKCILVLGLGDNVDPQFC